MLYLLPTFCATEVVIRMGLHPFVVQVINMFDIVTIRLRIERHLLAATGKKAAEVGGAIRAVLQVELPSLDYCTHDRYG
jgi:hypothetical protein